VTTPCAADIRMKKTSSNEITNTSFVFYLKEKQSFKYVFELLYANIHKFEFEFEKKMMKDYYRNCNIAFKPKDIR